MIKSLSNSLTKEWENKTIEETLMVTVEIIVRSKQHQKLLIKLGITTHRK
jgi:hypothetical protein